MKNFSFVKNTPSVILDGFHNIFDNLTPILEDDVSRYEKPIQSIRRSMGDDFWDLEKKDCDVLNVIIEDKGIFSLDIIRANPDLGNNLSRLIESLVDMFIASNDGKTKFTKENLEDRSKVRIATSREEDGCSNIMIKMNDFKDILEFKDDELIGIIHDSEIEVLANELKTLKEEYSKVANTDKSKANELSSEIVNKINKITNFKVEIAEKFFNDINKALGYDTLDEYFNDVYDIQLITKFELEDDENNSEKIKYAIIHDYHDINITEINKMKDCFEL